MEVYISGIGEDVSSEDRAWCVRKSVHKFEVECSKKRKYPNVLGAFWTQKSFKLYWDF